MNLPKITVFTRSEPVCKWCEKAKGLLDSIGLEFEEVDIFANERAAWRRFDHSTNGASTVPQIMIGDLHVGGYAALAKLYESGKLMALFGHLPKPGPIKLDGEWVESGKDI